jgi:hypothetical protein
LLVRYKEQAESAATAGRTTTKEGRVRFFILSSFRREAGRGPFQKTQATQENKPDLRSCRVRRHKKASKPAREERP